MMKLIKKIIAVFSVTLLIACKEEDLSNFYKNTENSITSAIYNIKNYSFKESWYRLKTAYNLVNRNRYYENQYIEIDTYPFWKDIAIAEVELNDENQKIELPKKLNVIKEVTNDERYKNAQLADSSKNINKYPEELKMM